MPMTLRRILAALSVAVGLFAFAPHASADISCTRITIPLLAFTSPDICIPGVP